jgi:hypothetical protein
MSMSKTIITSILWSTMVIFCFHILLDYERRPGPSTILSQCWPTGSSLELSSSSPYTLVMFVHPRCPCSNASISELDTLMASCEPLTTYVVFIRPNGLQAGWEKTALWQRVSAIPGVKPIADINGEECARFNARTSGETALYDGSGKLLFRGGITGARGHEGDNQGLSTVQAIIAGDAAGPANIAVFGCALNNDQDPVKEAKHVCLK